MKLDVTITKTSVGTSEYIQIMSEDQVSVNVVFVAEEIHVVDHRPYTDRHENIKEQTDE